MARCPGWSNKYQRSSYRCLARDRGYHRCEQSYIGTELVDEQVVVALAMLEIPLGFRDRVEARFKNVLKMLNHYGEWKKLKRL